MLPMLSSSESWGGGVSGLPSGLGGDGYTRVESRREDGDAVVLLL